MSPPSVNSGEERMYKLILAKFLQDYLRDTGAENYFPDVSLSVLEESISDEVLENFIEQLDGATLL